MNFKLLLDKSPICFAQVDLDKGILYANPALCAFTGYSCEELKSKQFSKITHPDDIEKDILEFERLLKGEISEYRLQKRYIQKSGKIVWGDLFVTRIPDELRDSYFSILASVVDINEIKQMQATLKKEKSNFKAMFMHNPQAMGIYSVETLEILEINEVACQLYGYTREELLKMRVTDLIPTEQDAKFREFLSQNISTLNDGQIWGIITKSGEKRMVETASHLINYKGISARHVMIMDVTERKIEEMALIENRDSIRYAQVIAKMGSWEYDILADKMKWSTNLYRLFKVNPEEVNPSFSFMKSRLHPDDMNLSENIFEDYSLNKEILNSEVRIILPGDEIIWVQISTVPFFLGDKLTKLKGVIIDITEMKNFELSLIQKIGLERLFNEISFNFINCNTINLDYSIQEALLKVGQFTNVDRVYVFQLSNEGKTMDNTHEWCAADVDPQIDNLKAIPTDVFPWWMDQLKQNKLINFQNIGDFPKDANAEREILEAQDIISILVIPMFFENKLIGFVGFDSVKNEKEWHDDDIHIIKSLVDLISGELFRMKSELKLKDAKEKAEESSRLKSSFLAIVSHELRTPLNPILGFSSILMENSTDEMVLEFAGLIHKSGSEMMYLLEDLFDLSFQKGQRVQCNNKPVLYIDLYSIAFASLEEIIINSGKSDQIEIVTTDYAQYLNYELEIDQAKVLHVLSILFKNAVKFIQQGEIEFGTEINKEIKTMKLFVRDTGIGIEEEKIRIIFNRFRQADDSTTRPYGGLGIGLTIAKQLANIMGGTIDVESQVGIGSKFSFTIPVNIHLKEENNNNPNVLIHGDEMSVLNGKTILIVDDNLFVHEIIKLQLKSFNIILRTATNGLEAIRVIKNQAPDFILMDLVMPVMDGFEAVTYIRALCPHIPIAALTAHSLPKDRKRALEAGCNEIITKPVHQDILFHVLKKYLTKGISHNFQGN